MFPISNSNIPSPISNNVFSIPDRPSNGPIKNNFEKEFQEMTTKPNEYSREIDALKQKFKLPDNNPISTKASEVIKKMITEPSKKSDGLEKVLLENAVQKSKKLIPIEVSKIIYNLSTANRFNILSQSDKLDDLIKRSELDLENLKDFSGFSEKLSQTKTVYTDQKPKTPAKKTQINLNCERTKISIEGGKVSIEGKGCGR